MKNENGKATSKAWRLVGTARDTKGESWAVYQNAAKPQWFKARPGTSEAQSMGFEGSFLGLVDCVQCMGLQGFQLTI